MATQLGTVLLGGGTGFIGSALSSKLMKKGYDVVIVSRKAISKNDIDKSLKTMTWNDLQAQGLPDDTTAVVNVAGQNILDPFRNWSPGFKQNVWASRVNTTKYLATAIENASVKPKVFVTMSGVGYYAPSETEEYTENSKGGDFDFLSELCTNWEAASKVNSELPVRTVNVRSGVVLGRKGGMIQQLIIPFFFGLGGPVGSGKQYMPWIHIEDIVGLFIHSIENDKVEGPLNGVSPQIITNKEFSNAFGSALRRPAFIPLPAFFVDWWFGEDRSKIMTEGQKVIPKKALDSGYEFVYPNIEDAAAEFAHLFVDDLS